MTIGIAPIGRLPIGAQQQQSGATSLTPGAGSIVLTGFTPAVTSGLSLTPGAGSVVFNGQTPTVAAGLTLLPGAGAVTFNGFAPGVTTGLTVLPGAGSVVLTGLAPALTSDTVLAPGAGNISLNGFAPTVSASGGADTTIAAGVGSIVLTGFVPTITGDAVAISTTPPGGYDAGGFGKWFNGAVGVSGPLARPARRDTEIGRMLDELVYGPEITEPAQEIVAKAAARIETQTYPVDTEVRALTVVAQEHAEFAALFKQDAAAIRAAFVESVQREQAMRQWRMARDEEDLFVMAELLED